MNNMPFRSQLDREFAAAHGQVFPHETPGDDIQIALDLARADDYPFLIEFPDLDIREEQVELLPGKRRKPREVPVEIIEGRLI